MKGKSLVLIAAAVVTAAVAFTACNKQNDESTGLNVFVTDANGVIVTDKDGQPLTEEWKTSVVYATDENGETYTNINGDAVTVKQTRPALTSIIYHTRPVYDDEGNKVTDKNGEVVTVNHTIAYTKPVFKPVVDDEGETQTNAQGEVLTEQATQVVTEPSGEKVTGEDGEVVTEAVTELVTENVTHIIDVTYEHVVTKHYTTHKSSTTKTTSVFENPDYAPTQTTKEKETFTLPEVKIAATLDKMQGIGGKLNDKYLKVIPTGSGAFAALGNTQSTDGPFKEFSQSGYYSFITKYDADGNQQWICPIGSSKHTRMYDFAMLSDGSYIAVGESTASDLGFENPKNSYYSVIAKISSGGQVLWYKHIGGTSTDYFTAVAATPDGGFAAGGKFLSTDGDFAGLGLKGTDAVVAKFNSNGEIQWSQRIGGDKNEAMRGVASDSTGNIYIACHSNSEEYNSTSTLSQNVVVVKYSANGEKLWESTLEGSKTEEVNDIYADATGCVIVGRYASSDGSFAVNRGGYDGYIAHLTAADGKFDVLQTYGGIKNDNIYSLAKTDFGYAAVGVTESENRDFKDIGNKGGTDGFILSVNTAGNIEHIKAFAGSGNDAAYDICSLGSRTYAVVGESYSKDGDFTPVSSAGKGTAVLGIYKIY